MITIAIGYDLEAKHPELKEEILDLIKSKGHVPYHEFVNTDLRVSVFTFDEEPPIVSPTEVFEGQDIDSAE